MSKKGFVLRINEVKDHDLFVTIFLKEFGKVSLYAKNANKANSKRKRALDIMNFVEIIINKSKNNPDFWFLKEVKLINNFEIIKIKKNFYKESFILSEIILKLIPLKEPMIEIYNLMEKVVVLDLKNKINNKLFKNNIEKKIFIYLCLHIINYLGFLPEIDKCLKNNIKFQKNHKVYASISPPGYKIIDKNSKNQKASEQLILNAIKIQKYYLANVNKLDKIIKLNYSDRLIDFLYNLQLDWIEAIVEKPLKSRNYFQ